MARYRIADDTWIETIGVLIPDLDPKFPKKDDPDLGTFKGETDVVIRKIIRDEIRRLNDGEPVRERKDEKDG